MKRATERNESANACGPVQGPPCGPEGTTAAAVLLSCSRFDGAFMTARDTLLLDQGFQPIKVIPWQRALCMHFVGKVEVLRDYEWMIRTVSSAFPAPAVVRLLRKQVTRPLHVRFSRENVYLRDNHRCQ